MHCLALSLQLLSQHTMLLEEWQLPHPEHQHPRHTVNKCSNSSATGRPSEASQCRLAAHGAGSNGLPLLVINAQLVATCSSNQRSVFLSKSKITLLPAYAPVNSAVRCAKAPAYTSSITTGQHCTGQATVPPGALADLPQSCQRALGCKNALHAECNLSVNITRMPHLLLRPWRRHRLRSVPACWAAA